MTVRIESLARHEPEVSDGVRFRIFSSRHGELARQVTQSCGGSTEC